jgi:uncharacterized membrane protein
MIQLLGISFIKLANPFLKKYLCREINTYEYVFATSSVLTIIAFIYGYIYKQAKITNLACLTPLQVSIILFVAITTYYTTTEIIKIQLKDGIAKTSFLLKAISAVLTVMIGIIVFEEKITYSNLVGIVFVLIGVFLLVKD